MDARRRPFYRSVRFRLTAWYTLLLSVVLVAVGVALSSLVSRQLREDVDNRLIRTAEAIVPQIQIEVTSNRLEQNVLIGIPKINPLTAPGEVIQVINRDGLIVGGSDDQTNTPLPSVELSGRAPSPRYLTSRADGVPVRTLSYPIIGDVTGVFAGKLVVAESLRPVDRTLDLLRRLLLLASPIGIAVAALGGWLLAGRALRPIDRITATAAAIAADAGGAQSLSTRLTVPETGDEIARLAATFNRMLDRLEETFTLQRRFIADASHELRTPLTAIRGNIDVMMRQAATETQRGEDFDAALDDLRRESARMSRLIQDLLTLARTDAPPDGALRRQPVALDGVVQDAVRTAQSLGHGQVVAVQTVPGVTIIADRDRITELVLILLDNALRHTPTDGRIDVILEQRSTSSVLTVRDTGEGIAPEHLPHLFDRFYRVDAARHRTTGGTGLGLAIAQAIARSHGGDIAVSSVVGSGTTFTVMLPLAATLVQAPEVAATSTT